jgi:hypothetical protein
MSSETWKDFGSGFTEKRPAQIIILIHLTDNAVH